MENPIQRKIKVIADRISICAADDMKSHKNEFDLNTTIFQIIELIEIHEEYHLFGGGIWAGKNDNYKTVRTNTGNYLIDKSESAVRFFHGIEKEITFERNSKKCI